MLLWRNGRNTDAGLTVVFDRKRLGATTPEPESAIPSMTHYTSTTQATCARCGERTTRSKLCRDCGRDEYRESTITDSEPAGPRLFECVDCEGLLRDPAGLGACPDCGSYRHVEVSDR